MVILSAGLKGIAAEMLEAARVDGASEWQIFWRVIFPLLAADHRGRRDDDGDHRAQGVRHRLRDDQRQLRHRGHRQPDVQGDVQRSATSGGPAPSPWCCCVAIVPVMMLQHPPVPGAGGDAMTARTHPRCHRAPRRRARRAGRELRARSGRAAPRRSPAGLTGSGWCRRSGCWSLVPAAGGWCRTRLVDGASRRRSSSRSSNYQRGADDQQHGAELRQQPVRSPSRPR